MANNTGAMAMHVSRMDVAVDNNWCEVGVGTRSVC